MELYTPEEVAEMLKVQPRTVREWLRDKKLKGAKLGKEWRVKKEDIEAFISASMNK